MTKLHNGMFAVLLATALAGCGAEPEGNASPREVIDDSLTLQLGDIIEGEWQAGPRDRIFVSIDGTRPFGWNIHGHGGSEAITIIEDFDQTHVEHEFEPPVNGTWNLLVANRGGEALDVAVHMELYNAAEWSGWGP